MKKRLLSIVLVLAMTLTLLPVQVFAAESENAQILTENSEAADESNYDSAENDSSVQEAENPDTTAGETADPESTESTEDTSETKDENETDPETDSTEDKDSAAASESASNQETTVPDPAEADTIPEESEQSTVSTIITGFMPLSQNSFTVSASASESDAASVLPSSVIAYVKDCSEPVSVAVVWSCPDFAAEGQSAFTFYASIPGYTLADGVAVPSAIVTVENKEDTEEQSDETAAEEDSEETDEEDVYFRAIYSAENEAYVYNFLREVLNLNVAQACGVMGNLYVESAFDPGAYNGNDSGGTTSYGLCQWNSGSNNNGRYYSLISWCSSNGYDYTTLDGQLYFMKHELESTSYYRYSTLLTYDNTSDGAYDAALLWAKYYEGCSSASYDIRAGYAADTYWPKYSNDSTAYGGDSTDELTIEGATMPSVLTVGSSFTIKGVISSDSILNYVIVGVYDVSGSRIIGEKVTPYSTTYDLSEVDDDILFGTLPAGVYTYKVIAKNSDGKFTLVSKVFPVFSKSVTVSDGAYRFCSTLNSSYVLTPNGKSTSVGAPIVLSAWSANTAQIYDITHIGNGYYSIIDQASGYALTAQGTSMLQAEYTGSTSQLWQILPVGDSWALIPKSSKKCCAGAALGTAKENAVISVYAANISNNSQLFKVTKCSFVPSVKSASLSEDGVLIKWDAVAGATGYYVYRKTYGGSYGRIATTSSTSYTDTSSLTPGTTYYYTLRAYNASSRSTYEKGTAVTYVAAPVLNSVTQTKTAVTVKWDKVSGAEEYAVYRKPASGGSWKKIAVTDLTSYIDVSDKTDGETYIYTVRACIGSTWSSYDHTGLSLLYLADAELISAKMGSKGITVKWSAVTGAQSYAVYRKPYEGRWTKIATTTSTSYLDSSVLENGETYVYTVRAKYGSSIGGFDAAGVSAEYVAAPTLCKITLKGSNITVKWSESAGAASYAVYRKTEDSGWTKLGITTSLSYTDSTSKDSGTTYIYTVRAKLDSVWGTYDASGLSINF